MLLLLWAVFPRQAFCQADLTSPLSVSSPMLYNPGFTGMEELGGSLGFRRQWTTVSGGPAQLYLQVSSASDLKFKTGRRHRYAFFKTTDTSKTLLKPLGRLKHLHGIGGTVWQQSTGALQRTSLRLSYARHISLNNNLRLSLGVSTGFSAWRLNLADVRLANPRDPAFIASSAYTPDLSIGLALCSSHGYAGIGMGQLQPVRPDFGGSLETVFMPDFNFSGAWLFPADANVLIIPSVTGNISKSGEYNARIGLRITDEGLASAGLNIGMRGTMGAVLSFNLTQELALYYAYEFNGFAAYEPYGSNHDLMLAYRVHSPLSKLFR